MNTQSPMTLDEKLWAAEKEISTLRSENERLTKIIDECAAEVEPVDPNDTEAVFAGSLPEAVRLTAQRAEAAEARISTLEGERDEAIREAVKQERESCAFSAETVSGFGDPWTIETIAANIRTRGPADEQELVHVPRETWEEFQRLTTTLEELRIENEQQSKDADHWMDRTILAEAQLASLTTTLEELRRAVEEKDRQIATAKEGFRMIGEIGQEQLQELMRYREFYGPLPALQQPNKEER